jgi:putative ribosome biogenesis GTPase RsgA
VRDAVAADEISAERYDSYLRLLEELERSARAW